MGGEGPGADLLTNISANVCARKAKLCCCNSTNWDSKSWRRIALRLARTQPPNILLVFLGNFFSASMLSMSSAWDRALLPRKTKWGADQGFEGKACESQSPKACTKMHWFENQTDIHSRFWSRLTLGTSTTVSTVGTSCKGSICATTVGGSARSCANLVRFNKSCLILRLAMAGHGWPWEGPGSFLHVGVCCPASFNPRPRQ